MARTHGSTSVRSKAPGCQQAWQAMRVMRRFTSADLLMTCPAIGESGLHKYMRALANTGFTRCVQPRVSGRPGSRDVWMLVRDTGPQAPIKRWKGGGVFDPNTGHEHELDGSPAAGLPAQHATQGGRGPGLQPGDGLPRHEGEVHG